MPTYEQCERLESWPFTNQQPILAAGSRSLVKRGLTYPSNCANCKKCLDPPGIDAEGRGSTLAKLLHGTWYS